MWDGILSTGTELPPPHPPSTSHHRKDHEQKPNLKASIDKGQCATIGRRVGSAPLAKEKGGQCVISKEKGWAVRH